MDNPELESVTLELKKRVQLTGTKFCDYQSLNRLTINKLFRSRNGGLHSGA